MRERQFVADKIVQDQSINYKNLHNVFEHHIKIQLTFFVQI